MELDDTILDEGADTASRGWARSVAIIAIAVGLMGIGAVMSFSASVRLDPPAAGTALWKLPVFRQMVFILGGLAAMLISSRVPYRVWARGSGSLAIAVLAAALAINALTFVPGIGVEVNQARRWVRLGPDSLGLRFQPSELVKILLPVFLAVWTTRGMGIGPANDWAGNVRQFRRGLLPCLIAIAAAVGLVGIEDFGTAALLALVGGAMLLVAGAKLWHLAMLILPAVPAFGYLLMSRSHRLSRVMEFQNIWDSPEHKDYQVVQSLCTIASGGWWGRGLGRGFVKTYLPEARTDFIYAVICEELGVIGGALVIALLIAFLWQCRMVIRDCPDAMGRLLAFGIAATVGVQAAINIAVVTVTVPTKGISLPLVSAGGSGAIFLGVLVGILASIPLYGGMSSARRE